MATTANRAPQSDCGRDCQPRLGGCVKSGRKAGQEQGWNLPAVRKITLELPDLSDAGVLAVLIGSGYKDKTAVGLAEELLDKYESLYGIAGQRLSDMAKIKGLGDAKVIRIAAAYEIVARVVKILEAE